MMLLGRGEMLIAAPMERQDERGTAPKEGGVDTEAAERVLTRCFATGGDGLAFGGAQAGCGLEPSEGAFGISRGPKGIRGLECLGALCAATHGHGPSGGSLRVLNAGAAYESSDSGIARRAFRDLVQPLRRGGDVSSCPFTNNGTVGGVAGGAFGERGSPLR